MNDAWASAQAVADRHGVRVTELHEISEHHAAAALLCRVWHADSPDSVLNAATIRALSHAGNYVVGAYQGEKLVGATVAFFGAGHLHSHVAGVDATRQGGGVGYAMKMHQRAWALDRHIEEVRWTFDPLVRRNAYFNLHKLGALPTRYLPDFYGELVDGINTGDRSDRLYVTWRLTSARVVAAAHGDPSDVDIKALRAGGAAVLVERAEERPAPGGGLPDDGRPVLVAVPGDIERLRSTDPAAAGAWRIAVREALTSALAAGYRITGLAREGYYVLERHR